MPLNQLELNDCAENYIRKTFLVILVIQYVINAAC